MSGGVVAEKVESYFNLENGYKQGFVDLNPGIPFHNDAVVIRGQNLTT